MEKTYSKKSFDTYKLRVMIKLNYVEYIRNVKVPGDLDITVYTDETDKEKILEWVNSKKKPIVTSVEIFHTATKEQDDRATEFIEEDLNDW